jgi:hypothetical protein
MAKLQEEVVVIKVSKLLKDTESPSRMLNEEMLASLEAVVHELAGSNTMVEVQEA